MSTASQRTAKFDAREVAALLREYGQRSSLKGGNPYRWKAYSRAADSLNALAFPLEQLIEEGRLTEIPGVGDAIADIITKMHRTGTHPSLEKLRYEVPSGVLELFAVPGLRADKILRLYKDLGITSLAELEAAAREDRIKKTKGLGAALQTKILQNLQIAKGGLEGRLHIHRAWALLEHAAGMLKHANPDLQRITMAGDARRGCELVSNLAIVAEASKKHAGSITSSSGIQLRIASRKNFGAALLAATGSQEHLTQLQNVAEKLGMTLDEGGLRKSGKLIAAATEEEIYAGLGLQYIEPELREGLCEIELSQKHKLPKLVIDKDVKGILHCHTDYSDGVETLENMAKATRDRGYQYFGVADHSKSAHYAGGLSIEQIERQRREIDRLNTSFGTQFRILKGIEADILADGSLDYPDGVLARFDFVVASVHSRFKLDHDIQTRRLLKAVSNPYTTILGHMSGRQLLRRPGYEIEIEAVLKACGEHGVAVEVNAHPWRLDLDWRWHQLALKYGCLMSINPDAHSIRELDNLHWGIEMARKGGVPAKRVLNCMTLAQIIRHLKAREHSRVRAA